MGERAVAVAFASLACLAAACSRGSKSRPDPVAETATAPEKPMPPASVTAPPAVPLVGTPDLTPLLGSRADGWNPKVFAGLREGMTPAEAGKALAYADAYDEFGIADIPVGDVKGVQRYRLVYLHGKLTFAEIWFDASLDTPAFRATLVEACTAKWGAPWKAGDDPTWVGADYHTVKVAKIDFPGTKGWLVQVRLR